MKAAAIFIKKHAGFDYKWTDITFSPDFYWIIVTAMSETKFGPMMMGD